MPVAPTVPTDTGARIEADEDIPELPALALCYAPPSEGWRPGEIAFIKERCTLGRDGELKFALQRPGECVETRPLSDESVSHKQLQFTPDDRGHVHVKNLGRAKLRINGTPCTEAWLEPGDVVELVGHYVFLFTMRPEAMPRLQYWRRFDYVFGEPDAFSTVGEAPIVWMYGDRLAQLALMNGPVLIHGESGTGKEACARVIHALSGRKGPFKAENIPNCDNEIGLAHLFGHGAEVTGQRGLKARIGRIESAAGGTFFIDEIGELSQKMQASLLRLVQFREIVPIGENDGRVVDVRIIAATNRHIHDRQHLKFDLVGRLIDRAMTPALDERREDIMLIVRDILLKLCKEAPSHPARRFVHDDVIAIDPELVVALLRQDYLTNVHELQQIIAASIAVSRGNVLRVPMNADVVWRPLDRSRRRATKLTPEEARAEYAKYERNLNKAAGANCVSRHVFYRLLLKAPPQEP